MSDEKKSPTNPPADTDADVVAQKKRLDYDVAGHEENFDPKAEDGANKRNEAEAQIAANYADHQAPDAVEGKPERDVKADRSEDQAEADEDN